MARKSQITLTPGWALYLRTSSEEAQAPERSQASQRRMINERVVTGSDLPINQEYADTFTGHSTDRQNYQRLLTDAREGRFSHVGIAFVDRFGRNDVEGIRAFDELTALGIKVRIATYPSLDPATPDGRMVVGLLFSVARFESDRTGQRSREGMLTKLLEGGWSFLAPDGYLNREVKTNTVDVPDKLNHARYKRWVELDPDQAKVWRYAWELLLENHLSLADICEVLHKRGYRLRTGTPFVRVTASGAHYPYVEVLSRVFHNWFYAGWVVIHNDWANIPPKTVPGQWEPMVSTKDFERGIALLQQRSKSCPHKSKHFYLLTSLVYMQYPDGPIVKMIGSTTNSGRANGGVPYYCIQGSRPAHILCRKVDSAVRDLMHAIQIDEEWIPRLRKAYLDHLDVFGNEQTEEYTILEDALKRIDEEEERTARLYAAGRISENIWNTLWMEWHDKRTSIQASLKAMTSTRASHVQNLDTALRLMAIIGILYERLDKHEQKNVLRQVVRRIIVNPEGLIVKVELHTPFMYLCGLAANSKSSLSASGVLEAAGNKKSSLVGLDSSRFMFLGVPFGLKDEPLTTLANRVLRFLHSTTYPQRAHIERLLVTS